MPQPSLKIQAAGFSFHVHTRVEQVPQIVPVPAALNKANFISSSSTQTFLSVPCISVTVFVQSSEEWARKLARLLDMERGNRR